MYHWNTVSDSSIYKAQHSNRFKKAWRSTTKYEKKDQPISSAIQFHNQRLKLQLSQNLVMQLQYNLNIHVRAILITKYTSERSCENQCFRTTRRTWNQPISDTFQPANDTTKRQPTPSRCKETYTVESRKKQTCQYSNHYRLFHTASPVQKIKCDWSTLERIEILMCPRPSHWPKTSRLPYMWK